MVDWMIDPSPTNSRRVLKTNLSPPRVPKVAWTIASQDRTDHTFVEVVLRRRKILRTQLRELSHRWEWVIDEFSKSKKWMLVSTSKNQNVLYIGPIEESRIHGYLEFGYYRINTFIRRSVIAESTPPFSVQLLPNQCLRIGWREIMNRHDSKEKIIIINKISDEHVYSEKIKPVGRTAAAARARVWTGPTLSKTSLLHKSGVPLCWHLIFNHFFCC